MVQGQIAAGRSRGRVLRQLVGYADLVGVARAKEALDRGDVGAERLLRPREHEVQGRAFRGGRVLWGGPARRTTESTLERTTSYKDEHFCIGVYELERASASSVNDVTYI